MARCPLRPHTVGLSQCRRCFVGCALILCLYVVGMRVSWCPGVRRVGVPSVADSFTTLLLFCTTKAANQSGRAADGSVDVDVDGYWCKPLPSTVVRIGNGSGGVEVTPKPEMTSVGLREQNERVLRQVGAGSEPLVTLFTTMKDTPLRDQIHRNTLANWAVLSPFVKPVLFVPTDRSGNESTSWTALARKHGWHVLSAERTIRGVPILKEMFRILSDRHLDTPFLGYANADILFDGELPKTLGAILDSYGGERALRKKRILLTGRRKNVNVHYLRDGACLTCLEEIASRSRMYRSDAEDYFIVSKAGFPWKDVPDFIVGSPGYDNWLVAKAIKWQIDVIDGSRTINAIHQVNVEGVRAGWNFNKDPYINLRMVSGSFNYGLGHCTCAPFRTSYSFQDCPSALKSCIKLVQTHPNDIPDQCHEASSFTTDSYIDNFLDHDY